MLAAGADLVSRRGLASHARHSDGAIRPRARRERAVQTFETEADAILRARLGATLPKDDLNSLREALEELLDMMENDLGHLAEGQVHLTGAQQAVLNRVRQEVVSARDMTQPERRYYETQKEGG